MKYLTPFLVLIILTTYSVADDKLGDYYGFSGLEIYKVSNNSFNLSVGDINGDGHQDLALVNNYKARVDFFVRHFNNKSTQEDLSAEELINLIEDDNTFSKSSYPLNTKVLSFTLAKINQDALADMVFVTEDKEMVIALQLANSKWSTQKFSLKSAAIGKNALKIYDLNNDKVNDVIVLCKSEMILFYQAKGKFHSTVTSYLYKDPGNVFVGDLNGDGRSDLLTFYPKKRTPLTYRLQNKRNSFALETVCQTPPLRYVSLHDADRDGISEIYTIHKVTGRLKSYTLSKKTSQSSFGQMKYFSFTERGESGLRSMAIGDIDGDRLKDIVVTEPGTAQIALYTQLSDGELGSPSYFPCCESGQQLYYLGKGKLLVYSEREQIIGVIEFNKEKKRLSFPQPIATEGKILCMDCNDIDGDGDLDILYVAKTSITQFFILKQNKLGNFVALKPIRLSKLRNAPKQIKLLDLNQDQRADVILTIPYVGTRVYIQNNKGKFTSLPAKKDSAVFKDIPLAKISTGDIDGDSKKEILIGKKNYARALVVKNNKLVTVDQFNSENSKSNIDTVMMMNIDGDQKSEMLFLDNSRSKIVFLKKKDSGIYDEYNNTSIIPFNFRKWFTTDVNNDNNDDLVIAGTKKFGILYRGGSDYQLVEESSYESSLKSAHYRLLSLGDVNDDGQADIVLSETTKHLIDILSFNKQNKMVSALKYQVFEYTDFDRSGKKHGKGLREIVIRDVNGDNKNDLLVLIHDRLLFYPQD